MINEMQTNESVLFADPDVSDMYERFDIFTFIMSHARGWIGKDIEMTDCETDIFLLDQF